jgi:hypothetical protein
MTTTDATPWIEVAPGHYQCSVGGLVDVQVMPFDMDSDGQTVPPIPGTVETITETHGEDFPLSQCLASALQAARELCTELKIAAYDREHDETKLTNLHIDAVAQALRKVGAYACVNNGHTLHFKYGGDAWTRDNPTVGYFYTICRAFEIELKEPQP